MQSAKKLLARVTLLIVVSVQLCMPVAVVAQTAPAPDETTSTVNEVAPPEAVVAPAIQQPLTEPVIPTTTLVNTPTTTTGPVKPTGADATEYTLNKTTGMWENDYYTWDPVTKQTSPKTPQNYSFNPETNHWDTKKWYYSPEQGKYVAQVTSSEVAPATQQISNTGPGSTNTIDTDQPTSLLIDGTGPNSNNSISLDSGGNGIFDLFFNATISHTINSTATSGNASVIQNTTGGSALTGDAKTIANIVNILQSSWGMNGSDIMSFLSTIDGNVVGDLYLDPGQLGPTNLAVQTTTPYDDLAVTIGVDGKIINNVTLAATSGNATVAGNTTAGNATSGDAYALANVMNLINSAISAGKSFVGTINIAGNLEGDILLPSWLKQEMLASSNNAGSTTWNGLIDTTGPDSTNTITGSNTSSLDTDFSTQQTIQNNIDATATTGNALVTDNTKAGNATSGDAATNITLLNLTGRQVIGSNSLLVFVNVLGEWLGMIMDAPTGSTSAMLGGGITQNNALPGGNLTIDASNKSAIENNIDVTANSGDATVRHNTLAGNATTGDATASANVLNVVNSQFSLSDWFGVLFINVLGTWKGSFGVDTAYGNTPSPKVTVTNSVTSSGISNVTTQAESSSDSSVGGHNVAVGVASTGPQRGVWDYDTKVAASAAANTFPKTPVTPASFNSVLGTKTDMNSPSSSDDSMWWIAGIAGFTSILLFGGDRLLLMMRKP